MSIRTRIVLLILCLLAPVVVAGCLTVFRRVDATPVPDRPFIQTPVKLHLLDGSVVLYQNGATFQPDTVRGIGTRYGLTLTPIQPAPRRISVPVDSIAAAETYQQNIRPLESLVATSLGTIAGAFGTAIALVAIFGSCPTIYSDPYGSPILEAESFSTSIVPLFEMRDVDRLAVQPGPDGRLTLEVRNEALETHYINHLELVEVTHPVGRTAIPGERGEAFVLGSFSAPASARDATGRDVAAILTEADGSAYETAPAVLAAADAQALMDTLLLTFPTSGAGGTAVYLRLRNSLLSTVFLYDYMLAAQGAGSLDWLGRGINSIQGALELSSFYQARMGIHVDVWDGEVYRTIGRVREAGPIAWDDVAFRVPPVNTDSVRVRLRFVADSWRIDRIALATEVDDGQMQRIPFSSLSEVPGPVAASAAENLSKSDERYHVTTPGERFLVHFEATPPAPDTARTYFIAAQGYYTEWIRGSWLRDATEPHAFRASDEVLADALKRWTEVKGDFEARFNETRIPVR